MPNEASDDRPRPIYLSTECTCSHTYNWHVPGGVCQVPGCKCKEFVVRDQA